jgi:dTDP-4-amino-4,6-dideoxygalactose transaminase
MLAAPTIVAGLLAGAGVMTMLVANPICESKITMAVPLLDLSKQHAAMMVQLKQAFSDVLQSGQFILGEYVEQFEGQLREYCKTKHAIGVTSGTDALLVAMMAMGIGPGDEVITTPLTFFCTGGCIARLGAKPVFVDVDPSTYNIEVSGIEKAITKATKAIIPVHLFGLAADMGPIMKIAKAHNLKVIEDAAQALGGKYRGHMLGSIGDVGCYSFYPSKNLAALGDGGACVTNDDALAERIRQLRVHGADRADHFPHIGGNFRLDALQAAMLSVKLPYLDGWGEARRGHAKRYGRYLEALPVTTPSEPQKHYHVYNQYTIRVRGGGRDPLREHLTACGIGCRVYYPLPVHLQPCFGYLGNVRGSFPVAEQAADEALSLPNYPEMTAQQQEQVVRGIRDFFEAE